MTGHLFDGALMSTFCYVLFLSATNSVPIVFFFSANKTCNKTYLVPNALNLAWIGYSSVDLDTLLLTSAFAGVY